MHKKSKTAYYIGRISVVRKGLRMRTSGGYAMLPKKGSSRIQAMITQFSYDHRKLEGRMEKIRKNATELGKFLDSMPPKKTGK